MDNKGRSKFKKTQNKKQTPKNPQKNTEPDFRPAKVVNEVQAASTEVKNSAAEKLSARDNHESATAEKKSNEPKVELNDQVEIRPNQEKNQAIAQKKDVDEMKDGSAEARVNAKEQISAKETHDAETAEQECNQPELKLTNQVDTQLNQEEESGSTQDAGVVKINHSTEDQREIESRTTENNEVSTNIKNDNSQPKIELNEQMDSQENKKENPDPRSSEETKKKVLTDIEKESNEQSLPTNDSTHASFVLNDEIKTTQEESDLKCEIKTEEEATAQSEPAVDGEEISQITNPHSSEKPKKEGLLDMEKESNQKSSPTNDSTHLSFVLNDKIKTTEEQSDLKCEIKTEEEATAQSIPADDETEMKKEGVKISQITGSTQDAGVVKINHSTEDQREMESRTTENDEVSTNVNNDNSQPTIESNEQMDSQENKKENPACTQEVVFKIELSAENKDHVEEEFRTTKINDDSINDGNNDNLLTKQSNEQVDSQINKEVKTLEETSTELQTEVLKILNQMKGTLFLILLQNQLYYEKHYGRNKQKLDSDSDSEQPKSGDDPRSSKETKKEVLTDIEKESNEQSLPTNDSTHASFVLNDEINTTQEESDLKCKINTEEEATAQSEPADDRVEIPQIINPHSSEKPKKEVLLDMEKESNQKSSPTNDSTHLSFVRNDKIKTTEEQSDLKCEIKTEEEATAQSKPADDEMEMKKGVEISQITNPEHKNGDQEIIKTELQQEMQTNGEIKIPDERVKTNSLNEFVSDLDPDVTQPIVEDIPDDPLRFHAVHGENIIISKGGFRAQRLKSSNFFSKGVAFSSRPVKLGEQVSFRLEQLSSYWLGLITFGFTNKDPNTLADNLPSNITTDQDSKDGYWVVYLDKKYCQESNKLHYFLNSSGNMCFGINGVDQGEFFWKLDTSKPIWAMVYIFGYFTALEFDNPKILDHRDIGKKYSSVEPSDLTDCQSQSSEQNLEQTCTSSQKMVKVLPLSFQTQFVPLDLNTQVKGVRVQFLEGRGICVTSDIKGGYIFLKEPLIVGQTIVIQNLSAKRQPQLFCIGIKYHPTIQGDAKTLNNLPDPVAINISMQYKDELGITFTENGEIRVTKNCEMPNTILINAKLTQQLWPFVAIYRRNQIIRIWSNNIPTSAMIKE